ncbi:MAG TPA: 3-oxoacyl-ACP reductase FabG [Bacillota bacterium]|nr:3-oxoacyl-ACP reductase FabG [Bacillota bacterium]HPE39079.1 3-oxoacyl-ACP reductase FabG [Bacillota bacterium]
MSKYVLITGGSRGIGAATAVAFAKEGYHVSIFYRQASASANAVVQEIEGLGVKAEAFQVDIRDYASVRKIVEEMLGRHPIDVVISNAGIARIGLYTDTTPEQWQEMTDTHINGLYNVTQAVLPHMISKKDGSIITVSSMWGQIGASCEVSYSTAKAAIIGFTKALAKEVGPSNIRVNCVAPGVIDTDMNKDIDEKTRNELCEETPLCRMGEPDEVAQAILFLASEKSSFITGQVIAPNGGMVM